MKPTQNQIELIKTIAGIVTSWGVTNDINSPTHYGDIPEELSLIADEADIDQTLILQKVKSSLSDLLSCVRQLERKTFN